MRRRMSRQDDQNSIGWEPFEKMAGRYDAWFDSDHGRLIFDVESACIRELLERAPRPWLEIGVGSGRFAAALGVDEGLDPSSAALQLASRRGIRVRKGRAEELSYEDKRFGTIILVVTICFLDNPEKALRECRRVMRNDGCLVVGLVPKDGSWGENYARKGAEGHPFYSAATFYSPGEVIELARRAGLFFKRARSCLFEAADEIVLKYRHPEEGLVNGAGFSALMFEAMNNTRTNGEVK